MNGWRRKRAKERGSQVNFRCDRVEVRMLEEMMDAYGVTKGELLRMLVHREHAWLATGKEVARPPLRPSPVAYLEKARRMVAESGRGASCVDDGQDDDDDEDDAGVDRVERPSVERPSVKGTG